VVTLEPGIYVRGADVLASDVYEALPAGDRAAIAEALGRYADVGVRIEDDVLVTDGEPDVLSDALPRTVEGLEAFLAGGFAPGRDR